MTSLILAATLLVAGLQGLPPLVGPLVPDGSGVVTGTVRHATTGRPIADAQVAVTAPGESIEQALAHATVTGRDGRFTIKGVAPGERVVVAQAEGFFGLSDEIPVSAPASRDITVGEGQQVDSGVLELIPGAAISGRIAGSDGQPATAATVQALRASYIRGQLTFTLMKSTFTDDLGEYRLFWLPPGEYYIRGQYRTAAADRPERYERMFFPGIAEEDAAPPVAVSAGSEISGIDIRVPVVPVTGFTISGRVTGPAPDAPDWRVAAVHVVPRDRRVILVGDDADTFQNQAADSSQGQFEIRNVPPGEYNLLPVVRNSNGNVRTASVPVSVATADIENISVVLEPEAELRGRLTWDGDVPGNRLGANSILVTAVDRFPGVQGADAVAVDVDAKTGEFLVAHLSPGKYAFRLASLYRLSDVYIADVEQGGASVMDSGFTIGSEPPESLNVMLKSQGGVVSGIVLDTTRLRPFAHSIVVLVPDAPRRQNFAMYKHMVSGPDGAFTFRGVPPGNYKLLALDSVTPGVWENPLFIQKYQDRGLSVSVESGSEKTLQLTIIP